MAYTERTTVSDHVASVGEKHTIVSPRGPPRGGNTRVLTFISDAPSRDIDLLLMFNPPPDTGKLYVDLFPICWKVISFIKGGTDRAIVTYSAETALLVPQVDSDNIVYSSYAQHCETGQECKLVTNGRQNYLTPAELAEPGVIKCHNETDRPGTIGIGFYDSTGSKVEPGFVWPIMPADYTLKAQLTPILQIYAVSDYKESELIRADIESPVILKQNLIALDPSTEWKVSIDPTTGDIVITQLKKTEA